MTTETRQYIDLDGKGDESIFIPGFDDPLEWEAKQTSQVQRGGGCCAGPQPIQGEQMNEQNMEKFYQETEENLDKEEGQNEEPQTPQIEFVDKSPQKKEAVEVTENQKFTTFAGEPQFNQSVENTPNKLQEPEVIHQQVQNIEQDIPQGQVSGGANYENLGNSHFDRRDRMDQALMKSGYGRIGGASAGHYRQSYRKYSHPNSRDEDFCTLI